MSKSEQKARVHFAKVTDHKKGSVGWVPVGWNPFPLTDDPVWLESKLGEPYKSFLSADEYQSEIVTTDWIVVEIDAENWNYIPKGITASKVRSLEWIEALDRQWWYVLDYIPEYYYEKGYEDGKVLSRNSKLDANELYCLGWDDGNGDRLTEYDLENSEI